jgi:drug/metabolite transporter (DMT)-like permease
VSSTIEAAGGQAGVVSNEHLPKPKGYVLKLTLALFAVWVFWGSTFAAIHYAIATIPPFVMASVRFTIAGIILWLICLAMGKARPTRADWIRGAVTGTTLLLLGNGVTSWCVQFVPTGLGSLLLSTSPIWMALFDFVATRERPARPAIAGMILGFAGMIVLLQPKATGALPLWPTALLIAASISWAFGSIYQRRSGGTNIVLATAMQMVIGGALLGIEALLFGEWQSFAWAAVTPSSLIALAWLIVFGSLCGYSAYVWSMQHAPVALGSTYAYINPLVALILGAVLFGERLTPLAIMASAIILVGVALMMVPRGLISRTIRLNW